MLRLGHSRSDDGLLELITHIDLCDWRIAAR